MKLRYLILIIATILVSQGCIEKRTPSSEVKGVIADYPTQSKIGEPITINWRVFYPPNMEMTHTAIHYGYFSHPGELGLDTRSKDLEYQGVVEVYPDLLQNNKNNFKVTIVPHQKGTLYFRAHSIIDENNYWFEEQSIQIQT